MMDRNQLMTFRDSIPIICQMLDQLWKLNAHHYHVEEVEVYVKKYNHKLIYTHDMGYLVLPNIDMEDDEDEKQNSDPGV